MGFFANNQDAMYPPQPIKVYVIQIAYEATIEGVFFSKTKAQRHIDKLLATVYMGCSKDDVFITEHEVVE